MITRRSLIAGLIAAPAVVKAASLMPVRTPLIWRPKVFVLPMPDVVDVWKFVQVRVPPGYDEIEIGHGFIMASPKRQGAWVEYWCKRAADHTLLGSCSVCEV